MPPISVMLKPVSSLCNLACKYCFYHSLSTQRQSYSYGQMCQNTLQNAIISALLYADGDAVNLAFQGGEPMLRGLEFFDLVSQITQKNNHKNSKITLSLQTSGVLLDNNWCQALKRDNWLVGVSLDGDFAANINRVDKQGRPVFDKILRAIELLKRHQIEFNILSVVSEDSAKVIAKTYKFFTSKGLKHLQFIPCLSPFDDKNSTFSIKKYTYAKFLMTLLQLYLNDIKTGNYTSVRQLDNFVMLAKGQPAEQCGMNGFCNRQFVVEADGTVFPCDFYCLDKYKLGNINDTGFLQLQSHPVAVQFLKDSCIKDPKCNDCQFYSLCHGGCKRERLSLDKCEAYKRFFAYALPYLKKIY